MSPDRRPKPSSEHVARFMSQLKTTGTKPELLLRRALHRRGLRFRVDHRLVVGRPDIVLTRARIAVFVDGCFWHGCPIHATAPKSNAAWWEQKLARNKARDLEVTRTLSGEGWLVMRFWEHDDPEASADRVASAWRERLHKDEHT